MADVTRTINIIVKAQTEGSQSTLDKLKDTLTDVGDSGRQAAKEIGKSVADAVGNAEKMAQGFTLVAKAAGASGDAAAQLGRTMGALVTGNWGVALIGIMSDVTTDIINATKATDDWKGRLEAVGGAAGDLDEKLSVLADRMDERVDAFQKEQRAQEIISRDGYALRLEAAREAALKFQEGSEEYYAYAAMLEAKFVHDQEELEDRHGKVVASQNAELHRAAVEREKEHKEISEKEAERFKKLQADMKQQADDMQALADKVRIFWADLVVGADKAEEEQKKFNQQMKETASLFISGAQGDSGAYTMADQLADAKKAHDAALAAEKQAIHDADEARKKSNEAHKKQLEDIASAYQNVTTAVGDMALAIAEAGDGGLAAVHKQLKAEALRSTVMGLESLAVAGFDFAIGNFPGATAALIAAGQFAAVAALEGIGSAATAGASSNGNNGGGGGYGSSGAPGGGYASNSNAGQAQHTTIVVNVGSQLATQKEVGDAVVKAVQSSYTGGGLANGTLMVRGARRTGG